MIKINNIEIKGIRGIKSALPFILQPTRSLIIYGENGSGKSSITDAFEWFYYDKIAHLSGQEISPSKKGIEALRNESLSHDDIATIDIEFSDKKLSSKKSLYYQRSKLVGENSNTSKEFNEYIAQSLYERLILRYRNLIDFIVATKSEKLSEISSIIGYEEVSETQAVFKKVIGELSRTIKGKDFENQISAKKAQIMEQVNQQIHTDEQYFKAIESLVTLLNLQVKITSDASVESILKTIQKPEDKTKIEIQLSCEKVIQNLNDFVKSCRNITDAYEKCYIKYKAVFKDVNNFNKIRLEKLLSEGLILLEKGYIQANICPLCLQDKNRDQLIKDLRRRLEELKSLTSEKNEISTAIESADTIVKRYVNVVKFTLQEKCLQNKELLPIKNLLDDLQKKLSNSSSDLVKMASFKHVPENVQTLITIDGKLFEKAIDTLKKYKEQLQTNKAESQKISVYSKIQLVKDKYNDIRVLKSEFEMLTYKLQSMTAIYDEFVKTQKNELKLFLKKISADMNILYTYMNDTDKVEEIELIPLGDEDELVGLTIQFKFHGKIVTPPERYLSESHLNCLGICLFLMAIKIFNKTNKFFILDDVISSFDRNHRIKFAQLLLEKFSDYQIFLFTHERDWFEYIANAVKGKNWIINEVVWDYDRGVITRVPLTDLYGRIERKISTSETSGLGNLMRQYLEQSLKDICLNLGVRLAFRFNDENENRMTTELLSGLKHTLKERSCPIKDEKVFDRIANSNFLGNKTSHNSKFEESIPDLKAFFSDIKELHAHFCCMDSECQQLLSIKYLDNVNNKIRCKCGRLISDWKA